MKRAFIFPGQGSQYVGMGREVADSFSEAKDVFEEVDEILKQNLSQMVFAGEMEELSLTENTQPALMATSIAIFKVLEKQGNMSLSNVAAYVAGHSLGEYSALTAAKSITLSDSANLLKIRGRAMQKAVPRGEGGMIVLIGADLEKSQSISEQAGNKAGGQVCQPANDNSPQQVVLSGTAEAIDLVESIAKEHGIKRAVKLPVSAPFHSELMKPAAEVMAEALEATTINAPEVSLVANVTAAETRDPAEIRKLLIEQVTGMVRWRETIKYLEQQGITETVEVGAGKVLSGLVKRTTDKINTINIETPADIDSFLRRI